jgi:hypothetical protein
MKSYYDSIALEYPLLDFIFRLFAVCSSSEAEVERYFSHESHVHNFLRNSLKAIEVCLLSFRSHLSNSEVFAIMFVRWNYEPVMVNKIVRFWERLLSLQEPLLETDILAYQD